MGNLLIISRLPLRGNPENDGFFNIILEKILKRHIFSNALRLFLERLFKHVYWGLLSTILTENTLCTEIISYLHSYFWTRFLILNKKQTLLWLMERTFCLFLKCPWYFRLEFTCVNFKIICSNLNQIFVILVGKSWEYQKLKSKLKRELRLACNRARGCLV